MVEGVARVRQHRTVTGEAFNFNWTLHVPPELQMPFEVTHESVAALDLRLDQPIHARAANLRRMFSALVAGNIREPIIQQVEKRGPFEISGDPKLMRHIDALLAAFVAQKRMKLSGEYHPVYRVIA
jgi:hypothetical protein